jgi:hypothetical protein
LPVFASGVLTVVLIGVIARELLPGPAGWMAAFISSCVVLRLEAFRECSREILSDLPQLACYSLSAFAFLRCFASSDRRLAWLVGGLAATVAVLMRMTNLALLLPYLWLLVSRRGERSVLRSAALFFLPVVVGLGALLVYQEVTFHAWFSTGYHYWLSPNSYELSIRHWPPAWNEMIHPFTQPAQREGLVRIAESSSLWIPVLFGLLCRACRPGLWERSRRLLLYLGATGVPLIAFFLLYPFALRRFVLPVHVFWYLLGGVWFAGVVGPWMRPWAQVFLCLIVMRLASLGGFDFQKSFLTSRQELFTELNARLPDDGVFITGQDEFLVDALIVGETRRRHIPLTSRLSRESWRVGRRGEVRRQVGVVSSSTDPTQIDDLLEQGAIVLLVDDAGRHAPEVVQVQKLLERFAAVEVFRLDENRRLLRLARR